MQRTKVLIVLAILIIALIFVSKCSYEKKENEIVVQQRLSEVSKYLSDKYGDGVKFNILNYSTLEEFRAVYCLANNSNIQFGVDYWVNKQQYSDDYLQRVLANELETIIKDKFAELDLVDIKITVGSMLGPPFDLTNRLYERYKELGRNPQIQDIKGAEMFSYVTICFNDRKSLNGHEEEINKFLLDLPIERIDCEPFGRQGEKTGRQGGRQGDGSVVPMGWTGEPSPCPFGRTVPLSFIEIGKPLSFYDAQWESGDWIKGIDEAGGFGFIFSQMGGSGELGDFIGMIASAANDTFNPLSGRVAEGDIIVRVNKSQMFNSRELSFYFSKNDKSNYYYVKR